MKFKRLKNKIKKLIRGGVEPSDLIKRGAKVGSNVQIWTDKIDKNHAYLLEIGDNVTISDARVLLHDGSTKIPLGYSKIGKVIIGNNVFIGADAIILPDITIGDRVIVGAGAIVNKSIPSNSVVVGNPAKVISTYDDFVSRHKNLLTKRPVFDVYWADLTSKQKNDINQSLNDGGGFEL